MVYVWIRLERLVTGDLALNGSSLDKTGLKARKYF